MTTINRPHAQYSNEMYVASARQRESDVSLRGIIGSFSNNIPPDASARSAVEQTTMIHRQANTGHHGLPQSSVSCRSRAGKSTSLGLMQSVSPSPTLSNCPAGSPTTSNLNSNGCTVVPPIMGSTETASTATTIAREVLDDDYAIQAELAASHEANALMMPPLVPAAPSKDANFLPAWAKLADQVAGKWRGLDGKGKVASRLPRASLCSCKKMAVETGTTVVVMQAAGNMAVERPSRVCAKRGQEVSRLLWQLGLHI